MGPHPSQEEQALIREKQKVLMSYVENIKKQITTLKEQGMNAEQVELIQSEE